MARQQSRVQNLVASAKIAHAERRAQQLLARPRNTAKCDRPLGLDEIAVLPARLDAKSFACAIARFARNRAERRRIERRGHIDSTRCGPLDCCHPHLRDQSGRDHRAAEIIDQIAVIQIARVPARDDFGMFGVERRLAPVIADRSEVALATRFDIEVERRAASFVIDHDIGLADLGKGVAGATEFFEQRRLSRDNVLGNDWLGRSDPECCFKRGFFTRSIDALHLDAREFELFARCHRQRDSHPPTRRRRLDVG